MTFQKEMLQHPQKGLLIKVVEHPAIVYIAKQCGMDFVFYDCEHGVLSYRRLHDLMLLGKQMDLPSIVRVAQLARADISQILDYGATGVMVPMIETKEQAQNLVNWSKYPPLGKRSYSGGANTNYGPSGHHEEMMKSINEQTITIAQIETLKGVEHIEEILSVEGIDAILVGPCDLGISINNPDNVMDQKELALIKKVAQACKRTNTAFGIIGSNALLHVFQQEIDLFLSAIDTNLLRDGIKKAVASYEEMIGDKI